MGPSQATYGGKWAWFGGEKPLGFTFKTALDRYTTDTAFPSHAAFPCLSISLHTQTHASTQPSLRSEEAFSPLPSTEKSMQVAQTKLSRIVRGTAPPHAREAKLSEMCIPQDAELTTVLYHLPKMEIQGQVSPLR